MSPILTDNQRKRLAKWLTNLIFGTLLEWLLPWLLAIVALAILSVGFISLLALLAYRVFHA